MADDSRTTRRRFVRDAGIATVATGELLASRALAARPKRRNRPRPTVAVFGGGIAGLTAAHELAERGFDVTVYERRAWGGKARSTEVPGTGAGGRKPLPGEHGFRNFFGVYRNLLDTMRRIPFGADPRGTFGNLVVVPHVEYAWESGRSIVLPLAREQAARAFTPQQILDLIVAVMIEMQLPPDAASHLGRRMGVWLSSCDARRVGQWESTPWADFVSADRYGDEYRNLIGRLPEFTQGVKADRASTKFSAWVLETFVVYGLLGFGSDGPPGQMLDGPTNETLIDPWTAELHHLGARLRLRHELVRFHIRGGRIQGATVQTPRGRRRVAADWFVCALPVERARRLWTGGLAAADRGLLSGRKLETALASGIMFYLREPAKLVNGILACGESPWALSLVEQARLWRSDFADTYGDGRARNKISVIISTWDVPGVFGKAARDCTPEEVARDTWEQIKRHVNEPAETPNLSDEMLLGWDIDPGIKRRNGRWVGQDRLVLPSVGTERHRPDVYTAIPNLMLCGDYCNGAWEIANMESASFNGRRAANAVLHRAGSKEESAKTILPYRPPEWEPLKRVDEDRWQRGLPNLFDPG